MNDKENPVFNHSELINHCYLLILVNELRAKILKMKTLKN